MIHHTTENVNSKNVKFNGIDKSLLLGSTLRLGKTEQNKYSANLSYREENELMGNISSKGKSLAECISKMESILSKKRPSNNIQDYLDTLSGVSYLLDSNFNITISSSNNNLMNITVSAADEYPYLVNGVFSARTLSSNGVYDLFSQCNGWADTLLRHFQPKKEAAKVDDTPTL